MKTFAKKVQQFFADEQGATAVEYGLMVALIAAVIVATVALIGGQLKTAFEKVNTALTAAAA
jgi:pilus assembly protein Flp/PilA